MSAKTHKHPLLFSYEKYVHFNPDIEAAVLGVCLLEPDGFARISPILEPEHFHFTENQIVYSILKEIWADGQVVDLHTVTHQVYQNKLHDKFANHHNAAYYITRLTHDVVSGAHLERHALILRQLAIERLLVQIHMGAASHDGDSVDRILAVQSQIQAALSVKGTDDWLDMSQMMIVLHKHMEHVKDKPLLGIETGFPSLDKILYGLQPGQLIVIGARPSVGKSAFIGGIAMHAGSQQNRVGIVSLEMPSDQLAARFMAIYSGIEFWRIHRSLFESSEQESTLHDAMARASVLPIYTSDKAQVTVSDIRSKAYKLKKRHGSLQLLIIDYLQLVETEERSGNETREREISKISRALKLMAMDLKIPVVLLCQLNRESDKSTTKKPKMTNLRESGAIEQDADVVLMLHRDWKAGILTDEMGNSTETQAHIIVEKNRNGETMEIPIAFDPEKIRFYEPEPVFGQQWADDKPFG